MKCADFIKRYQCVLSAGKALVIEGLHSEPVQPELNGSLDNQLDVTITVY